MKKIFLIKRTSDHNKTGSILRTLLTVFSLIIFINGCAENKTNRQLSKGWPREGGPISSGKYRTVALKDLDNDGNIDMAAGGIAPNSLIISYGNGRGGMSEPQFLPVKGDVQSLVIADVDNDGYHDIIFSVQRGSSGVRIWLNQSGRKWKKGTGPVDINNYQGLDFADINNDGNIDIAAANATSETKGGIQVWLGDGKGNWFAETGPTITHKYMDVVLADFNDDGLLDMAGAGWGISGALKVWHGDGKGGWSSTPDLVKGSYYGLTVGDIDSDGNFDIIAATYRAGVQIFFGNGRGEFTKYSSIEEIGSYWDVLLIDIDGDDKHDILASSIDTNGVQAWRNRGRSSWVPIYGRFPDSGNYYGMDIADLNKNGVNDICAASYGDGLKFWHGRGEQLIGIQTRTAGSVGDSDIENGIEEIEENEVYTTISGHPEYKIDPGDILEITLWQGTEPIKEDVLVKPDGTISFGFLDDFFVKGYTIKKLDIELIEYLKSYVKEPRLDLIVKKYNSKFVTITGAIGRGVRGGGEHSGAGRYELTGKVSLLEMVSKAGGPAPGANLKEVRVRRKNGSTLSRDLYKAIYQDDLEEDLILDAGDLVFIPSITQDANRVYVFGEVEKPGMYIFSGDGMRMFEAISKAGGVTVFATSKSTKIVRGDIKKPEVISSDLQKLLVHGDHTQNIMLANGDLIYVPRGFLGDINIFLKRIKPLLQLVLTPARIVREYDYIDETLFE